MNTIHVTAPARRGSNMRKPEIQEMFARLRELNPHPTTELEYTTPFELLIAVLLSAQATDVGVNKATRKLYPVANTPRDILDLGEEGLKRYIATIGLFNAKAKNVIATCRILLEQYGGEVPHDRAALEALPGVGRKTANVVLNTAFGEPTMAVDTHIFRVANRTGLAPGKDVRVVEDNWSRSFCRIPARRTPLAHPARPLRLQGTQTRLPRLRDPRPMPLPRQDPRTRRKADNSKRLTSRHGNQPAKPTPSNHAGKACVCFYESQIPTPQSGLQKKSRPG